MWVLREGGGEGGGERGKGYVLYIQNYLTRCDPKRDAAYLGLAVLAVLAMYICTYIVSVLYNRVSDTYESI